MACGDLEFDGSTIFQHMVHHLGYIWLYVLLSARAPPEKLVGYLDLCLVARWSRQVQMRLFWVWARDIFAVRFYKRDLDGSKKVSELYDELLIYDIL